MRRTRLTILSLVLTLAAVATLSAQKPRLVVQRPDATRALKDIQYTLNGRLATVDEGDNVRVLDAGSHRMLYPQLRAYGADVTIGIKGDIVYSIALEGLWIQSLSTDSTWFLDAPPRTYLRAVGVGADGTVAVGGATYGGGGFVAVLEKGRRLRMLDTIRYAVTHVAVSADGRQIIGCNGDGELGSWIAATGRTQYSGTSGGVGTGTVTFAPNGLMGVSSLDGDVDVFDASGNRIKHIKARSRGYGLTLAFSNDGRLMLSGPNENGFSLWNIATTGWVADLGSAYRRCSALSPDGRTIAACDDTRVRFFDVDSLARGESPRAFGPLGSVTIGEPVLPTRLFPWLYADESRLLYFDSSAKGARLAVSGLTALSVYSRDRRKLHWKGPAPTIVGIEGNAQGITIEGIASSEVTAGALSLDGHDVLLADRTGRIALWDGATGRRRRDVGTHDGAPRITGIAIAPSGAYALSAAVDGSVRYWDLTTNEVVWTRSAGRAYSGAVAISPDGRWYAAVGLREIATDEPARMPTLEGATSHGMAFAPDGRIIAAYSTRGTPRRSVLLRYAPDNPEKVDTIAWSGDPAPHLLVTPDGDRILGQSEDGATIQIRNATDGALLVTLHDLGETQWSEWIAITPDNRYDMSANAARHAHWSIGGRWAPLEKHGRRERGLVERALKRPAR